MIEISVAVVLYIWRQGIGHADVVALLLSKGANPYDRTNHGRTCFDVARNKIKTKFILRKWHITMVIVVLHELGLYYFVETDSLIDLYQFLGKEDLTLE
jgi:ankyrin repeat protein